jgi:hypothetical protein
MTRLSSYQIVRNCTPQNSKLSTGRRQVSSGKARPPLIWGLVGLIMIGLLSCRASVGGEQTASPTALPAAAGIAAETPVPMNTPTRIPTQTPAPTATNTQNATPSPIPTITPTPEPSWQEVGAGSASGGGISNTAGVSADPSLAISPDGVPYVAWMDYSDGDAEIYVRMWDGSSWVEVGAGSASGGGISNNDFGSNSPSLAISPDGMPYVAWDDEGNGIEDNEIYIRKWDGSNWVEVGAGSASGGGISNNGGGSSGPSLAISPEGVPYVAWVDFISSGPNNIYVRKFDGSRWVEVGAGSASGGGISNHPGGSAFYGGSHHPSLAISPDGMPYVAWFHEIYQSGSWFGDIYIRQWNGGSWVEVGAGSASGEGISRNNGISDSPALAISPAGVPYVAWSDNSSKTFEIHVLKWDGSGWVEAGAGSASGEGISHAGSNPVASGGSYSPSIAISPDGAACIAWEDYNYGDDNIYVRKWDGGNWVEVGAGSASRTGISNGVGASIAPSVAISADGVIYVAYVSGNDEIYVLSFEN